MIPRPLRLASIALVAWTLAATVGATTAVDLSLQSMIDRADLILYGQVAETTALVGEDGELRTRVVLDVDRDLGDEASGRSEVVLEFMGGRDGDRVVTVEGIPRFEPGERVLVFAYEDEGLASPIVGVWQGLWRLGPEGLADESGRYLSPTPDGLAVGGEGGDLTEVLDLLAEILAGDAEVATLTRPEPGPGAEGPAAPATDPVPTDAAPADGEAEPEDASAADPATEAPATEEPAPADPAPEAPAAEEPGAEMEADEPDADPPAAEEPVTEEPVAEEPVVRLREPSDEALRETVLDAAAGWRDAGVDVRVEWDDAADDWIEAAAPELFGPDAITLTVSRSGEAGTRILVRSDLAGSATGAVAYELAGLLGAPREEDGLLSGRLTPGGDALPTATDAARLRAALERRPGDLDGDGDVDFYDLARIAEAYGRSGARLEADLDASGRVDDADLRLLRERYRFLPPAPEPPAGWMPEDAD